MKKRRYLTLVTTLSFSKKEEGKGPYFDADQIDEMLDSFEGRTIILTLMKS